MLKSLFVSSWLTALTVSLGYSLFLMLSQGISWPVLGVFLSALGPLSFIVSLYLRKVGRAERLPSLPIIITSVGVILGSQRIPPDYFPETSVLKQVSSLSPLLEGHIFILTLLGGLGWLIYLFWYVRLERPESPLYQGKSLPNFKSKDHNQKDVRLNDYLGQPTLWLIFRGNWCPLCMAQIKEIAEDYQTLSQLGVKTVLVSPQPHEHTQSLASKFGVPFEFIVDADFKLAHAWGLIHKQGLPMGMQALGYKSDTVFPTVVISNAQGKIVFLDLTDDYRLRPEPKTFINVFQELQEKV